MKLSLSYEKNKIKKLLREAEAYLVQNDVPKAGEISREIIDIDPSNAEAYYFLGETLCKQGKFKKSVKTLKQADKLLPEHPRIIHLLGWATYMNGDIDMILHGLTSVVSQRIQALLVLSLLSPDI